MTVTTVKADHAARLGVWTPWAEILCLACDYEHNSSPEMLARYPRRTRVADPAALVTADDYGEEGFESYPPPAICDRCRAECWVRSDVSLLQRLLLALGKATWEMDDIPGAEMRQTGGMCAAMALVVAGHEIVATDAENDHPDGLLLGIYDSDEWQEPIGDSPEISTIPEAVAWIISQARTLLAR